MSILNFIGRNTTKLTLSTALAMSFFLPSKAQANADNSTNLKRKIQFFDNVNVSENELTIRRFYADKNGELYKVYARKENSKSIFEGNITIHEYDKVPEGKTLMVRKGIESLETPQFANIKETRTEKQLVQTNPAALAKKESYTPKSTLEQALQNTQNETEKRSVSQIENIASANQIKSPKLKLTNELGLRLSKYGFVLSSALLTFFGTYNSLSRKKEEHPSLNSETLEYPAASTTVSQVQLAFAQEISANPGELRKLYRAFASEQKRTEGRNFLEKKIEPYLKIYQNSKIESPVRVYLDKHENVRYRNEKGRFISKDRALELLSNRKDLQEKQAA